MKLLSGIVTFLIYLIVHVATKVYENMDLESQDPRFNANLGLDQNLIWTKTVRCTPLDQSFCIFLIMPKWTNEGLVLHHIEILATSDIGSRKNLGKQKLWFSTSF